jgi:hypothetical protein
MDILTLRSDIKRLEQKLDTVMSFIESNHESRSKWLTSKEAMQIIGCKETKLKELRINGVLEYRYTGNSRGVMITRKSVEAFIKSTLTPLN